MPVIRERVERRPLTDEKRDALRRGLSAELGSAPATGEGPVLFEIPIDGTEQFDVIAVWGDWDGVHANDRAAILLDAYRATGREPSLVMGVTSDEAKDRGLLPWRVRLIDGDLNGFPAERITEVSRKAGGFLVRDGRYEFRVPTERLATEVISVLQQGLPGTQWFASVGLL